MERLDDNTLIAAFIGTAIVIGIVTNNDTKPQPQPSQSTHMEKSK